MGLPEVEEYEDGSARLLFCPDAYPYGGIDPMALLLYYFGFPVTAWDEGFGRQEPDEAVVWDRD